MSTSPVPPPSRRIIGAQYFLFFGMLGVFLPYFNLYLHALGFSGLQIGALSALRSVALVLFPPAWGWLADRFQIRKPIYVSCAAVSTAVWSLYLFAEDFWLLFAITACYGVFYAPLISFLETFAMEVLGQARQSYGTLRAWGSGSFILVVLVTGMLIDTLSIGLILPVILVGSLTLTLVSTGVPGVEKDGPSPPPSREQALFDGSFVRFLICGFLMLASHGTYYGFFSIHLESIGYDKAFIGAAWALASGAEILVMIASQRLFRRFPMESVLRASFLVAALRWLALAVTTSPWGVLAAQGLHAVTYGAFHMASILYVDRLTSARTKTLGQAVNNSISYGLGLMAGFFLNGWLYDTAGAPVLFALSAGVALAGGLLFAFWGRGARSGGQPRTAE